MVQATSTAQSKSTVQAKQVLLKHTGIFQFRINLFKYSQKSDKLESIRTQY